MRIVRLSRLQYKAVREQGTAIFLVAPGHLAAASERIVERHTTYWVIRKTGAAAKEAARLDSRT